MARSIPDSTLQAVFADTLKEPDTTLVELGNRHGVSASLASKMRRRAEEIALDNPGWSQRALVSQLIQDGWVSVRRTEYVLPPSRSCRCEHLDALHLRAATLKALAFLAALTGAATVGAVVRMVV